MLNWTEEDNTILLTKIYSIAASKRKSYCKYMAEIDVGLLIRSFLFLLTMPYSYEIYKNTH